MGSPASVAHGPGLVGTFLTVMLQGVLVAQVFTYVSTYPNDRAWIKALVAFLLIANTLNCVFDIWWVYDSLVSHFANLVSLETGNWVFATNCSMVGIISTTVQVFFAWRVKVLTDNIWAVMVILLTSLCSILGGIGTSIAIGIVPKFDQFQKFQALVIVWLIGAAVCDITITISLSWYLRRHKTGFSNTDGILNKIIRLTIQNGLITAIWAIVDLITFLVTTSGLHLAFNFPLAKLYSNCLMASLNSRAGWKYQSSESTGKNIQLSDRVFTGQRDVLNLSTATRPEVYINVESHEMVDAPDNKPDVKWARHTAKNLAGSENSV